MHCATVRCNNRQSSEVRWLADAGDDGLADQAGAGRHLAHCRALADASATPQQNRHSSANGNRQGGPPGLAHERHLVKVTNIDGIACGVTVTVIDELDGNHM